MVIPQTLAEQKHHSRSKKTENAWSKAKITSTQSLSTIVLAEEFTQRQTWWKERNLLYKYFYILAKVELKHSPQSQDFDH